MARNVCHDADRGRCLEIIHQQIGKRSADHRAAAEAHDRHAGRHAAPVGKPFDQRRHRRDVAEAKTDAADHAGAEPHQPQLVDVDADRAEHEAAAPAACRDDARLCAGPTRSSQPPQIAADDAEHDEEQRVHPAQAGDAPVAGGREKLLDERHVGTRLRRGDAERARQRQPEHAEAVGHADAQMDAERGRRHQPAIETRPWQ